MFNRLLWKMDEHGPFINDELWCFIATLNTQKGVYVFVLLQRFRGGDWVAVRGSQGLETCQCLKWIQCSHDLYQHCFALEEHLSALGSSIQPIPLTYTLSMLVLVILKTYLTWNFPIEGNCAGIPPTVDGRNTWFPANNPESHWTRNQLCHWDFWFEVWIRLN